MQVLVAIHCGYAIRFDLNPTVSAGFCSHESSSQALGIIAAGRTVEKSEPSESGPERSF